MKKIVAVILTSVMLLGVMSVATLAADGFDPWNLADFGQKSWTIKATDDAPVIDGKIEDGEYAVAEMGLAVANKDNDDRFFVVDAPSNLVVDVYMNYDGDRFYLGVVIDGPELITEVAPNGSLDGRLITIFGADKDNFERSKMYKVEVNPEATSANGVDEVASVIEGSKLTYEMAVTKNDMLDKYGLDELDRIYLMLLITDVTEESMSNKDLWNEFYFGFKSSQLKEIFPDGYPRYCHVVFLEEADPETEAPSGETEAPETEAPAGDTDAPATEAPITETPETETSAESGCGSSVAAVGVALVAALGTCAVFASKKR